MKIGQGFDIHALASGYKLIIGGVEIPYEKGLKGHSDADVLLHALCDALIGAAGLGDIGRHFPDTDLGYKGIDSRKLLRETARLISNARYKLVNMDATIIAEQPKMAPHISKMIAHIASDLDVSPEVINIKAKTMEKLGSLGRGEGIAAEVVVLLDKA